MRYSTILLAGTCFLFLVACESTPVETSPPVTTMTTIFLVRHAEKDTISKNPDLSEAGRARAQALQKMLEHVALDAIYSTDFKRTMQTAEPVALQHQLKIDKYDPTELPAFLQQLRLKHPGEKVLIVGHSNTTPALLNLISNSGDYSTFPEYEYDGLYIAQEAGTVFEIIHLKYGN
ncbi:MAG: histidine phosphatase family protein [Saprospiraceae bacterium]|nr:histidine phosphatase family protein [Saprospiraceae bacterium]